MTHTLPQPHAHIMEIAPYKAGKSAVSGLQRVIKLSSNESPFDPSYAVMDAVRSALGNLKRYPESGARSLCEAIGKAHGVNPDLVVPGNGSDEVIGLLIQAFADAGEEIVYSEHGFLMYKIYAQAHGVKAITAPEKNYTAQVDALLAKVKDKTRIVFLANPNNPTGSYVPESELRRLRKELREDVLLVIDAAYAEYADIDDYITGHELVEETGNTVVTRTFSKLYALPGLRIGWAHCPPQVADALNRIRAPFNMNNLAIAAGKAALKDTAFVKRAQEWNRKCLDTLPARFKAIGITPHPSVGNFLMLEFPQTSGKTADDADVFLNENGIILRKIAAYGLPQCLRMTIGTEEENEAALSVMTSFMQGTARVRA